jgi:hypothetical protein
MSELKKYLSLLGKRCKSDCVEDFYAYKFKWKLRTEPSYLLVGTYEELDLIET